MSRSSHQNSAESRSEWLASGNGGGEGSITCGGRGGTGVSEAVAEERCCGGHCSASTLKFTKNLTPILPSFEPPPPSFVKDNTRDLYQALVFIDSTLSCLTRSSQPLNLFSTTTLTLNHLLEVMCEFECYFRSLINDCLIVPCEQSAAQNLTLDGTFESYSSPTTSGFGLFNSNCNIATASGVAFPRSQENITDTVPYNIYISNNKNSNNNKIMEKNYQQLKHFNFVMMVFFFSLDQIKYQELESMFEELCGVNTNNVPICDLSEIFLEKWMEMATLFLSYANAPSGTTSSVCQSDEASSSKFYTTADRRERASTATSERSLETAPLRQRTEDELEDFGHLKIHLLQKSSLMDISKVIPNGINTVAADGDFGGYNDKYTTNIDYSLTKEPLVFSYHNMPNVKCVCHGAEENPEYNLKFHLEAGKPEDIVRYMASLCLDCSHDCNCGTQVGMFLVTYRCFISVIELVDFLLDQIYSLFPNTFGAKPIRLFYGYITLLIDVVVNIFETGRPLGNRLLSLWRLMYCLILTGCYNLALGLRKALQHHEVVSDPQRMVDANPKVSMSVELRQHPSPVDALKLLMKTPPLKIAEQMTHTDEELFHSISLAEVVHWFYLKHDKPKSGELDNRRTTQPGMSSQITIDSSNSSECGGGAGVAGGGISRSNPNYYRYVCSNMNRSTTRFHFVNKWTLKIINSTECKSKKIKRVIFLFTLLESLFTLGNIHSAFAVFLGLTSSACAKIIHSVVEGNKCFSDMWNRLQIMTDMTRNHEGYRKTTANAVPPYVPYMGITMSDISTIKFTEKDRIASAKSTFAPDTRTHTLIALSPTSTIQLEQQIVEKGIKLPPPHLLPDNSFINNMVNVRKLWRYYNVLRCDITRSRKSHYNITLDCNIQTLILACNDLVVKPEIDK